MKANSCCWIEDINHPFEPGYFLFCFGDSLEINPDLAERRRDSESLKGFGVIVSVVSVLSTGSDGAKLSAFSPSLSLSLSLGGANNGATNSRERGIKIDTKTRRADCCCCCKTKPNSSVANGTSTVVLA